MKKIFLFCVLSALVITAGVAQDSEKFRLMIAEGDANANNPLIQACIAKCGEQQTRCQEKSSSRSSSSAFGFIMGKVCETAYTKCENICNNIGKPEQKKKEEDPHGDEEDA